MFAVIRQSVREFFDDDCASMAAAISYYTIFSLPPLLLLILLLVGTVMDPEDVRGALERQLQQLMGPAAGAQVRAIISQVEQPGGGLLATVLGLAALLFGATGAFAQLQGALNRAWEVTPDPRQGGIRGFLFKRLLSFGMVLAIAFLLLISLMVSALLSTFGDRLAALMPSGLSAPALQWLNLGISFIVITALFAAIFRVLPDVRISWRDVRMGAAVTAFLFVAGKYLIGLYLGRSNPGEAFGAAGSLAVTLLWIYYSSLILLFGAEFTQAWAKHRGTWIAPEPGAVRVKEERSSSRRNLRALDRHRVRPTPPPPQAMAVVGGNFLIFGVYSVFRTPERLPSMSPITALRQLLEQRYPDTAPLIQQVAPVLPTGIVVLDKILPGSGLPRGKLTAWQSEPGAGAILRSVCRTVVTGGERAAWIGSAGILTLDPAEITGMLLVRPATPRHALRSTEALLRSGGLALLVLTHVEPDRTASVRLTHAAREGGTALVVVARTIALASLRLSSRFLADRMQWARDPFGEPALPRTAMLEVRVDTLGWTRRVTISLPLTPYEFRLSPDPAWADRRGTPSRPHVSSAR